MPKSSTEFKLACHEISEILSSMENLTVGKAKSVIKDMCSKYSLSRIPRNYEILSTSNTENYDKLRIILMKKPIKTSSGIAVVALMPKPFACPHGRCTYCPGGPHINTPNSYTGKEPVAISAIEYEYDPTKQLSSKINRLISCGHNVSKLEIVIVGGTFLFMPKEYQENFIKSCYDTLNGFQSSNLTKAKANNEHTKIRCVGFTIETKPDFCKQIHVDSMLSFGVTRVEIGVQCLREHVYQIINRGHTFNDVIESFQIAKDAGYKIVAHMMPGLPTMSPMDDIEDFERLFADPLFKPDMLKIYPTLILKDTLLYSDYKNKKYVPYSNDEMIKTLVTIKSKIPRWVRIMRIQREISPDEITAGTKQGNLRQLVHEQLDKQGLKCKCIRCREIRLEKKIYLSDLVLSSLKYDSSGGIETFLSYDDNQDRIYGFLRLRKPSNLIQRPEITKNSCIVRELHIYGASIPVDVQQNAVQHSGLGKNLLLEAEKIAVEDFDSKKMLIISAVGTRQYYKKLGYSLNGPYMAKML